MIEWHVLQFKTFLLIYFRFAGLFMGAPLYGSQVIPRRLKATMALILALIMMPIMRLAPVVLPDNPGGYLVACFSEVAIGVIMGFSATILFLAFQMAGILMGQEMGFAMANVIDPVSNRRVSIVGQFNFLFALLVYLAIDGHHMLLSALVRSFDIVPLGTMAFEDPLPQLISFRLVGWMFVIGVKLASPVIVAIFFSTVAFGFISKVVPEMNLFIIGFAARIVIGLVGFTVMVPLMVVSFEGLFGLLLKDLNRIVDLMGGG